MVGAGIAAMIAGTLAGLVIHDRIPSDVFGKVIYAFVGIGGVWLIVNYPPPTHMLRGGGFVPLTRTQGRHLPAVPFDRDHFFSCGIPVTL